MERGFRVGERAQEVVDALLDVLGGSVRLFDAVEGKVHTFLLDSDWMSARASALVIARPGHCSLERLVNERWTLRLEREGAFDPSVLRLMAWAASELAKELPSGRAHVSFPPVPPAQGGSGGGPAELAIPAWWAAKIRR